MITGCLAVDIAILWNGWIGQCENGFIIFQAVERALDAQLFYCFAIWIRPANNNSFTSLIDNGKMGKGILRGTNPR